MWTKTGKTNQVFPNLFIFLVGPPGTGKTQALVPAMDMLRKSEATQLAPNDVTKQSLLDALSEAGRAIANPPGRKEALYEYHYLTLAVRELSNFMSQYDNQLAGMLTDIFDNPPVNAERKRTSKGSGAIINPSLAILAATATKNLGKTIHGDMWGSGFMSRVLLVYSAETPFVDIFAHDDDTPLEYPKDLIQHLTKISDLKGPMTWTPAAQAAFTEWRKEGEKPVPTHGKLVEYCARRWLHIVKLSMTAALSELRLEVTVEDFLLARKWLEEAEVVMPEIFRDMQSHSDGEILQELHMHMWQLYMTSGKKPVTASALTAWLVGKVASRDIARLIEVGEQAGLYNRMAGTSGPTAQYKPVANTNFDPGTLE